MFFHGLCVYDSLTTRPMAIFDPISSPKNEDGGFFHLRRRRSKIEKGSSIFRGEDRRWGCSSTKRRGFFEYRRGSSKNPSLHHQCSPPKIEEPPYLRSSIFGLEDGKTSLGPKIEIGCLLDNLYRRLLYIHVLITSYVKQ